MIAPNAGLSVNRQCTLLGIARSSFYYQRRPVSAEELDLLNRLDQIFTAHPVYGGGCRWRCCARGFPLGAGASDG
jgi:putative transposase